MCVLAMLMVILAAPPATRPALEPLPAVSFDQAINQHERVIARREVGTLMDHPPLSAGSRFSIPYRESVYVSRDGVEQLLFDGGWLYSGPGMGGTRFGVLGVLQHDRVLAVVYVDGQETRLMAFVRRDDAWVAPIASRHLLYHPKDLAWISGQHIGGLNWLSRRHVRSQVELRKHLDGSIEIVLPSSQEESNRWPRFRLVVAPRPGIEVYGATVTPE
jgi:hypothetical protein